MKFQKTDKVLITEGTKIRWFLKRLYEERVLSNDEYVMSIKLLNEKCSKLRKR